MTLRLVPAAALAQYEVAPYAAGCYFVTIPCSLLGSLIRSNDLVQLAPVGSGRGG
jgi:cytochrome c oxidase assembly protein Cox11